MPSVFIVLHTTKFWYYRLVTSCFIYYPADHISGIIGTWYLPVKFGRIIIDIQITRLSSIYACRDSRHILFKMLIVSTLKVGSYVRSVAVNADVDFVMLLVSVCHDSKPFMLELMAGTEILTSFSVKVDTTRCMKDPA